MTVGEKVSLTVGIVFRSGAAEGDRRYKPRYDLNEDGVIDSGDLAIVLDAPLCIRGRGGP